MLGFSFDPPKDCSLCPRLVAYRREAEARLPGAYNGAVGTFGDPKARLLIVGLAPGLQGANRTGRPFTGDHAGHLLYRSLLALGLASGTYGERADDGLQLEGVAITNAVRCVPPGNKPVGAEINICNSYLRSALGAFSELRAVLALGQVAHGAVVRALELKASTIGYAHGAEHSVALGERTLTLVDSYHCSRLNTNTGRLTDQMFLEVLKSAMGFARQG